MLAAGAVVAGRYELERPLGQGGMGVVWAARHTVTKRRVALKFLRGPAVLRPDMRRRFLREARAASAVMHPNLVEVHDVFELEDQIPVMVMELLEGETLGHKIAREGALGLAETCRLLLPVISAVGTAHAAGVVHRDLKPDNVFLSTKGSGETDVHVLDFGIAKLVGAEFAGTETGDITETGSMLGTPCYMSPEQSFGEKDIDHRADVWSLGVMIYECLAGARPVDGDSIGQVVKRLMMEGIVPIAVIAPSLPVAVTALVDRMLSRDKHDRPQDLREVLSVLEPFADTPAASFGPARAERDSMPSDSGKVVIGAGGADSGAKTEESGTDPTLRTELQTAAPHTFTPQHRARSKAMRTGVLLAAVAASIGVAIAVSPPVRNPTPQPAALPVTAAPLAFEAAIAPAATSAPVQPPPVTMPAVAASASTPSRRPAPARTASIAVAVPAPPETAPSTTTTAGPAASTRASPRPRFVAEPPF